MSFAREDLLAAAAQVAPEFAELVARAVPDVELLAFVVVPLSDGEVARAMVATATGFSIVEGSAAGDSLIVACPLWRLRRVAELVADGVARVTLELDIDRAVVRPEPDGSSSVLPGSYEVLVPVPLATPLFVFAAALRDLVLAGGPLED